MIRIKQNIIFVYVQLDCEILFKVVVSGVSKSWVVKVLIG